MTINQTGSWVNCHCSWSRCPGPGLNGKKGWINGWTYTGMYGIRAAYKRNNKIIWTCIAWKLQSTWWNLNLEWIKQQDVLNKGVFISSFGQHSGTIPPCAYSDASPLVWCQCKPRWRGRPCFLMQQLWDLSSEAGVSAEVNGKQRGKKKKTHWPWKKHKTQSQKRETASALTVHRQI